MRLLRVFTKVSLCSFLLLEDLGISMSHFWLDLKFFLLFLGRNNVIKALDSLHEFVEFLYGGLLLILLRHFRFVLAALIMLTAHLSD